MKDTNYIGKQRLEMLERVSQRFGHMFQTIKKPGSETQIVSCHLTKEVMALVSETFKKFTPWQTLCVIGTDLHVTDIPGLFFSDVGAADEEVVEMNRIHTLLHPECFARFTSLLAKYVRRLPNEDPDRGCDFETLEERLAIPMFSSLPLGTSRGNRFQPPERTEEDYLRLARMIEARSHRRKGFHP